jgi:chaperone modulatory protein CbpM
MSHAVAPVHVVAQVVEDELEFSLLELAAACGTTPAQLEALVAEGVIVPIAASLEVWRFAGSSLARTRLALRLLQDLEVNPPALALLLDMLEEITRLRAQLARR